MKLHILTIAFAVLTLSSCQSSQKEKNTITKPNELIVVEKKNNHT